MKEVFVFNEQKTAQIAAWFLAQERGTMPHLKLMKLMYLAERESMEKHGFPMTGDRFVSMEHGPVLSRTLNHINGSIDSARDGWDSWISDKANHTVGLVREVDPDAFDELSVADLNVLHSTWKKFGWMTKYQLRDFTHDPKNCPEWKDPNESSAPISYETVFQAVGFSPEVAKAMDADLKAQNFVSKALMS
jgi:uncharacterized phage-associated protein